MLANSLTPHSFSKDGQRASASGRRLREPNPRPTPAKAQKGYCRILRNRGSRAFPERRSSLTQRVSLAATPRPARAQATAGDRVSMIARLVCWLAIWSYLAVLSVQLFKLYAG